MRGWWRHLPNVVSSIRILLVVPIALAVHHRQPVTTLWLFGAAAASDALDGFLAKRYGWQSELGGILDPLADKLMLATVFGMLALLGSVPLWLTMAVIARDAIIVLGSLAYRVLLGPVEARPSPISKLNTLCQVAFILVVVGSQLFPWPHAVMLALGSLVLVTVTVSGLDYVLVYGRMAAVQARTGQPLARAGGSNPV